MIPPLVRELLEEATEAMEKAEPQATMRVAAWTYGVLMAAIDENYPPDELTSIHKAVMRGLKDPRFEFSDHA